MEQNSLSDIGRYATPFKLGRPVVQGSGVRGSFDALAVDCPFVFRHGDRFCMMYVGFDGIGYRTGLAESGDLLNWTFKGMMLDRAPAGSPESASWDGVGAAGSWIVLESDGLYDTPRLKKIHGRYWMVYHSYPEPGYEAGGAKMGLAWCEDEELLDWHRLEAPVMAFEEGGAWERGGLYKCCVVESGGLYYMFYNAKESTDWPWTEQTGLAVSGDLKTWRRDPGNPLMRTAPGSFYSVYFSDPCVKYDGEAGRWVNFGFGYDGEHAQGALAVSHDLRSWDIADSPWLPVGRRGELDATHAHKSSVFYWEGTLYHFYCACRPAEPGDAAVVGSEEGAGGEFRCIALAASRALGDGRP